MGVLIDFFHYKRTGEVRIIDVKEGSTCPLPFHHEDGLIANGNTVLCIPCDAKVVKVNHPSFEGTKWYEMKEKGGESD